MEQIDGWKMDRAGGFAMLENQLVILGKLAGNINTRF